MALTIDKAIGHARYRKINQTNIAAVMLCGAVQISVSTAERTDSAGFVVGASDLSINLAIDPLGVYSRLILLTGHSVQLM